MKAIDLSPQEFELHLTKAECLILANCLTETCNVIADFEFEMRLGDTKADVLALRDLLRAAAQ